VNCRTRRTLDFRTHIAATGFPVALSVWGSVDLLTIMQVCSMRPPLHGRTCRQTLDCSKVHFLAYCFPNSDNNSGWFNHGSTTVLPPCDFSFYAKESFFAWRH